MASNITQSVSFYNTAGVIEKEHNIYFVPRLNHTSGKTNALWLTAFTTLCPSPVAYTNKSVGQWRPEDKVLTIEGDIDDFRDVDTLRLNYMILTRTVDNTTRYIAYFLNSATQVGVNSVRLELEPDHFTNVFFLSDETTNLPDASTLFSNKMKRTYVKRQHIDRTTSLGADTAYEDIFANYEETFAFKRQYRDSKRPLLYGQDYFSSAELQTITLTETWGNLSSAIQIKILKVCCAFLHVVINKNNILIGGSTNVNGTGWESPVTFLPRTRPLTKNNLTKLICPIAVIPPFLDKFTDDIKGVYDTIGLYLNNYRIGLYQTLYPRVVGLKKLLENSYLHEYIVSAYITRESYLYKLMTFTNTLISINVKEYGGTGSYSEKDDYFAVYLASDYNTVMEDQLPKIISKEISYVKIEDSGQEEVRLRIHKSDGTYPSVGEYYICLVEREDKISFNLNLNTTIPDLKTTYYDKVLDYNPYSFYSISYLGQIEVPLNKRNYKQNNILNFELTVTVSDVCKYNLIPSYLISSNYQKFYQESLVATFANQLTITTEKLMDYVIANQTQMKNQYAVNDLNVGKGIVGGLLSGGATFGKQALMGNPVAGAMGGIQAGASALESAVSWAFGKEEIALNQKAKLADLGNLPNNLKQVGTDINIDILTDEFGLYLNHYRIDDLSYNSICKYLERYGYLINMFMPLEVYSRKYWNYIELVDFEFNVKVNVAQEESIRQIFQNGVTLLHDKTGLNDETKHNYEVVLDA